MKAGIHFYDRQIEGYRVRFLLDHKPGARDLAFCLHGLTCSKESFRLLPGHPGFSRTSILAPDLVGFGGTEKPADFSYTMEDQARLCETLVNELYPALPIHIVAHSMGGAVGLLFSPGFYQRVLTFTNIEGNLVTEDCGLLSRGIIGGSFEHYEKRGFERQKRKLTGTKMLRFDLTTPTAAYRSAQSLVQWSDSGKLLEKFRALQAKKAYFYGEENADMKILERLTDIECFQISNSGHEMMLDNPQEFNAKLAAFMYRQ